MCSSRPQEIALLKGGSFFFSSLFLAEEIRSKERGVKAVKERLNFQTSYVKRTANWQFNGSARGFHTPRTKAKCSAAVPDLQRVQITRKQSQENKGELFGLKEETRRPQKAEQRSNTRCLREVSGESII